MAIYSVRPDLQNANISLAIKVAKTVLIDSKLLFFANLFQSCGASLISEFSPS